MRRKGLALCLVRCGAATTGPWDVEVEETCLRLFLLVAG